jgi:hypothetical protein
MDRQSLLLEARLARGRTPVPGRHHGQIVGGFFLPPMTTSTQPPTRRKTDPLTGCAAGAVAAGVTTASTCNTVPVAAGVAAALGEHPATKAGMISTIESLGRICRPPETPAATPSPVVRASSATDPHRL